MWNMVEQPESQEAYQVKKSKRLEGGQQHSHRPGVTTPQQNWFNLTIQTKICRKFSFLYFLTFHLFQFLTILSNHI